MNYLLIVFIFIIGVIIGFTIGGFYMLRRTEIILKAREDVWDEYRGKSE